MLLTENSEVVVVCAKIEEEISELRMMKKRKNCLEYGLEESGLDKLIKC